MKAFFILMLLLNAGVFALFTINARDDAPPYPSQPADGSLRLLSEVPADEPPEPEPDDEAPDVTADDNGLECFSVAGLDRTDAEALAATVRTAGDVARVLEVEDRDFVGYWVYVPPHATMADAQETMAELADQGISDYGYVGGDDEHAVSLGVFSTRDRAAEREAEIRDLGIDTEIGERYRTATEYTLLVGVEDADALPAADWQPADCQDIED
ncbi:SPOR domain-containing protein [Aquisalimonas asiatica]|uniref:Sporulation related domain-containing protein n=1 Tax=Aquisalimonas asiatica TaxID=406100 RepID=A0A1H8U0Q3_9GAMM|nr:SPOR domain-containing protein [Aquisalimonas asiatica]SEO96228.1 Sporulation related domain-containing protein [Aquisalimonas asiatica]